MTSTKFASQGKVIGFELIRFVAASLVVSYHFLYCDLIYKVHPLLRFHGARSLLPWTSAFQAGWVGVNIFFVLSGLLISHSVQGSSATRFAASRILRLLPCVLICAPLSALLLSKLTPEVEQHPLAQLVRSVLFLPSGPWVDGSYWTLDVEVVFYAVAWIIISFSIPKIFTKAASTIGIISSFYWVVVAALYLSGKDVTHTSELRSAQLGLLSYGCCFALGVALHSIATHGPSSYKITGAILFTVASLGGIIAETHVIHVDEGAQNSALLPLALFVGSLVAIGLSLRLNEQLTSSLQTRQQSLIRNIGLATYPLYLFHNTVIFTVLYLLRGFGLPLLSSLLLGYATAVVISLWIVIQLEPTVRLALRPRVNWLCSTVGDAGKDLARYVGRRSPAASKEVGRATERALSARNGQD